MGDGTTLHSNPRKHYKAWGSPRRRLWSAIDPRFGCASWAAARRRLAVAAAPQPLAWRRTTPQPEKPPSKRVARPLSRNARREQKFTGRTHAGVTQALHLSLRAEKGAEYQFSRTSHAQDVTSTQKWARNATARPWRSARRASARAWSGTGSARRGTGSSSGTSSRPCSSSWRPRSPRTTASAGACPCPARRSSRPNQQCSPYSRLPAVESFATIDEPARRPLAPRATAPAPLPPARAAVSTVSVSDSDSADDASSGAPDDAASLDGIAVDDLEFMSGFLQQALDGPAPEPLASW